MSLSDNFQSIFFGYRVSLYFFFFFYLFNFFCRCLGKEILKWYSEREKNEAIKVREDKILKKRQLNYQAKLGMRLYLKVKSFGWVVFKVNTCRGTEAFFTVDSKCEFHAKLKGGFSKVLLEVEQPCVDLKVKKEENRCVIKMNKSNYRFSGMFFA